MRAWVLNLDAESELELGPRYTASTAMRARLRALAALVARSLPEGDRVIDPDLHVLDAPPERTAAWCPTPRALATLRRAALPLPDAPPREILARVNERGFAFDLAGQLSEEALPDVLRATALAPIEAHVARAGITGEWLLKRGLGVAGRGQRPIHAGAIGDADRAWIAASLRRGALYVEPRVAIVRELSVHGWATRRAEVRSIREQRVVDRSFVSSELAHALDPRLERALIDTGERVGAALIATGYRGPYGVDAYVWRTPSGAVSLRALSEINARYCMGWDARDGWDPPVRADVRLSRS